MYIERIRRKHGSKEYVTTLVRESYRDKGKVKHRTIANLSGLSQDIIQGIEARLSGTEVPIFKMSDFRIEKNREYGASKAFIDLANDLDLPKIIYSRKEQWRQDVLAMIVGRLIYQGSKMHLCHLHKDTFLWEATGYEGEEIPDVNEHCYAALDQLLARQAAIQKSLAKKHLSDGCLVLYDITSSYLEREYENSDLVAFGYSRDGKRKHEQIVIGLLTNAEGCPVAVKVFRGNTSDQTTVLEQAQQLALSFKVKDVVFVGDRGMLTPKRIEEVGALGYKTLTALSHVQLRGLCESGVISHEQFERNEIIEITDPSNHAVRYFLCKNPQKEVENKATRNSLIDCTKNELEKIASSEKGNEHQKSAQVGKVLSKYKVGKFFSWSFIDGKLHFSIDKERVKAEELLDGCFAVRTDSDLTKEQAVANYKSLARVERAFRNIKTMSLEIRPIYHRTDERIMAHVFLCMLAYYLEWHATKRLKALFVADGKGTQRRFTFSIVIERLKSICIQQCILGTTTLHGVITSPDPEQQKILSLLKGNAECHSST